MNSPGQSDPAGSPSAPTPELTGCSSGRPSWLSLVVLQPSPFCNINCDYCYLPDRALTHRMSMDTLQRSIEQIFSSDLVSQSVTFVWHAGEPLAVPISWYEEAFALIKKHAPPGVKIVHSVQSNGTLINDRWCAFIKEHDIHMGLSIDGPDFVHDAHRKTRKGMGTHALAMRGANLLRENGIFFHVISVISRESLDHADAIYDFFAEHGITQIGFNVEEMEGANTSSSLSGEGADRITGFFQTLFLRQQADQGRIRIREFDSALGRILGGSGNLIERFVYENEQVRPFGILSIDWQGNFSTFSPELLGLKSVDYGDFNFGNIHRDNLTEIIHNEKFIRVLIDIQNGVEKCRAECKYFSLCGGGAPANKYFENGTFASTRTQYCRYALQIPVELVMADLEKSIAAR